MIAAILIFFLAIFLGFALLGVTTYLYSRYLKSKKIKHFSSSSDFAAIQSSHDTAGSLDNELDSAYIYTPGGYIEDDEKREESVAFVPLTGNLSKTATHSDSSSDYLFSKSSSSYDSSSSDSPDGNNSGSGSSSD